jgi:hypothetical protein
VHLKESGFLDDEKLVAIVDCRPCAMSEVDESRRDRMMEPLIPNQKPFGQLLVEYSCV